MNHFNHTQVGKDQRDTSAAVKLSARLITAAVGVLILGTASAQVPKSLYSTDYRCIAETVAGVNHEANGHKLARFNDKLEFFLAHISNIPEEALRSYLGPRASENASTEELRATFASDKLDVTKHTESFIVEEGSYFIREPDVNPKERLYLFFGACTAYSVADKKLDEINCYESSGAKTFAFHAKSGRFAYSYVGTWHRPVKEGYHGDSSVFAFGTCKPYFR